jgi:SAM-dependent methyltransferase
MATTGPESDVAVRAADSAAPGAAVYEGFTLRFYDLIVGCNCRFAWSCPRSRVRQQYQESVSGRHLDIGVADGALLDRCTFPTPEPSITLMDLNPAPLAATAKRLARYAPRVHCANVLEPFGLPNGAFDSVGMSLVLHCVPGSIAQKAVAFDHAKSVLAPGGLLFGSTLLYGGVDNTRRARALMRLYNKTGIFSNIDDTLEDLDQALASRFSDYEIEVVGTNALFSARTA